MRGGNRINVIDGREKNEVYIQRKYLLPAAIDAIKKDAASYSGTWPEKYKQFLQNENNHHARRAWDYLMAQVVFETKVKGEQFLRALDKHLIFETADFSAWKAAVHHDREKGAYSTIYQNTFKNDLINLTKKLRGRGFIEINNYDDFLELTKDIKNLFDHSAIMPWRVRQKGATIVFTRGDMSVLEPNQLDYLALMAQTAKQGIYCKNNVVAQAMGCHPSTIGRIIARINRALLKRYREEIEEKGWWFSFEDAIQEGGAVQKLSGRNVDEGVGWGFEGYAKTPDGEIVNAGWRTEKPAFSRSEDDDETFRTKDLRYDRALAERINRPD